MGAWIEIGVEALMEPRKYRSLPLWERGLKFCRFKVAVGCNPVAPLVGAWIEIAFAEDLLNSALRSLPLWERGLKYAKGSV